MKKATKFSKYLLEIETDTGMLTATFRWYIRTIDHWHDDQIEETRMRRKKHLLIEHIKMDINSFAYFLYTKDIIVGIVLGLK